MVGLRGAITVDTNTGLVKADPLQLKRQVEQEEPSFNDASITSADWMSHPIAGMAEVPESKVVLHRDPEVGS